MPSLFSTGLKIKLIAILIYAACAFALVIIFNRAPTIENEVRLPSTHSQSLSSQTLLNIKIESTHDIQTWAITIDAERLKANHTSMRQWASDTYLHNANSRLVIDATPPRNTLPYALKVSLKTPHTYHEKTYWSEGSVLITAIDLADLYPSTK
jgi:hypothetical protein